MNYSRRKERNPHIYKDINIYNDLNDNISDNVIDEIIEKIIDDKLINITDENLSDENIIIEVEINDVIKDIEVDFDHKEKTISLEEVKGFEEIITKTPIKVITKTPLKEVTKTSLKEVTKTPLKEVTKTPLKINKNTKK